jgi:hypothetical protein
VRISLERERASNPFCSLRKKILFFFTFSAHLVEILLGLEQALELALRDGAGLERGAVPPRQVALRLELFHRLVDRRGSCKNKYLFLQE